MATNTSLTTTHYGLSQYGANDPVKFLTNYNSDMKAIDDALKAIADEADASVPNARKIAGLAMSADITLAQLIAAGLCAAPESGIWTPTLYGYNTAGSPAFAVSDNTWYKIGKLIYIRATITLSSLGGMTGAVEIGGLPFVTAGYAAIPFAYCNNLQLPTGWTLLHLDAGNNSAVGTVAVGGTSGYAWMDASELTDTSALQLCGTYKGV